MVCFDKQLASEWNKIAKVVQDLGTRLLGKTSNLYTV